MSPVDDALVAAAGAVATKLAGAGALVNRTARPAFDVKENHSTWYKLTAANRALIFGKSKVSLAEYQQARAKQADIKDAWEAFFDEYDVLILPSHSSQAFPKDESEPADDRRVTITKNGAPMDLQYWQPL